MAELTEGQKLTNRYIEIMKDSHACRFICEDGYLFDDSSAPGRGEYERMFTLSDVRKRSLQVQILRYLAWTTYADMQMILRLARMFAATQEIPNVVTDEAHITALMTSLMKMGCVVCRTYRSPDGQKGKGTLRCYTLTDRGAELFKDQTDYDEYIETNLVGKGELDVMKRLASNYIMTKYAPMIMASGCEPVYCQNVLSKDGEGIRKVLYGCIKGEKSYTVFEPAFYMRNASVAREQELVRRIEKRQKFLIQNLESAGDGKQKILVLVVENSSWLKRAYADYGETISKCDAVYVTTESLANAWTGEGPSPFMLVAVDRDKMKKTNTRSGGGGELFLKLEASERTDPPFVCRTKKK